MIHFVLFFIFHEISQTVVYYFHRKTDRRVVIEIWTKSLNFLARIPQKYKICLSSMDLESLPDEFPSTSELKSSIHFLSVTDSSIR